MSDQRGEAACQTHSLNLPLLVLYRMGIMLINVTQALGEMAIMFPVSGGFYTLAVRFIDPSWGFAMVSICNHLFECITGSICSRGLVLNRVGTMFSSGSVSCLLKSLQQQLLSSIGQSDRMAQQLSPSPYGLWSFGSQSSLSIFSERWVMPKKSVSLFDLGVHVVVPRSSNRLYSP